MSLRKFAGGAPVYVIGGGNLLLHIRTAFSSLFKEFDRFSDFVA
jgi:hypothetical protein